MIYLNNISEIITKAKEIKMINAFLILIKI